MPFDLTLLTGDIATGYYATQTDVEDLFGRTNVTRWSQLDPMLATVDTPRIARALAYADDQINSEFRGGPYEVPLSCGGSLPTVRYWAAVLAGVWLFTSADPLIVTTTTNVAGVVGTVTTAQANKLVSDVQTDMRLYKAGVRVLDAYRVDTRAATAPTIVK